jgi:hypothetical protein
LTTQERPKSTGLDGRPRFVQAHTATASCPHSSNSNLAFCPTWERDEIV